MATRILLVEVVLTWELYIYNVHVATDLAIRSRYNEAIVGRCRL